MNAIELRIGVKVLRRGYLPEDKTFSEITTTYHDIEACSRFPEHYKPIELTEEWLIKAGFEKEDKTLYDNCSRFKFKKDGSILRAKVCEVGFGIDHFTKRNNQMKYVHQLQNLYFCLTGSELTIKE